MGGGSCPNRSIWPPACEVQGVGPPSDPREEVALGESFEVTGIYLLQVSVVDHAWRYLSGANEFSQPSGGESVVFVVVVHPFIVLG